MMMMLNNMFNRVLRNEKGQGMAEYGLILALVAIVTIGAFTTMGSGLNTKIQNVATELSK